MAPVILLAIAVITATVLAKRHPEGFRQLTDHVVREFRTRLGGYSLTMVMQHMVEQMHASAIPSITKSYIPSEMTFGLHPRDVRRWGECFPQLSEELVALMLRSVSADPHLHLSEAGLTVRLVTDEQAEPGRPTFVARMAPAKRPTPDDGSPAKTPVHDGATVPDPAALRTVPGDETEVATFPAHWRLVFDQGETELLYGEAIVGRGRDVDVRIDAADVSRTHARFALLHDRVTLMDLESGNGTFVNEKPIEIAMLEDGDEVRFGSKVVARLERL